ncbi:MAG: hypothetical protein ACLP59_15355 [Bryobacteraceae bacterium]
MEVRLPVRPYLNGRLARVFTYERRINQRCPSADFLKGIEKAMRRRFDGQLDALSKDGGGVQYENQQRFHALHGDGKPLWEFKEHDHRLYCARLQRGTDRLDVVLFSGWIKDKKGRTEKED